MKLEAIGRPSQAGRWSLEKDPDITNELGSRRINDRKEIEDRLREKCDVWRKKEEKPGRKIKSHQSHQPTCDPQADRNTAGGLSFTVPAYRLSAEKISLLAGGEGGIRTHGGFHLSGFQDRRNRPLCHLSHFRRKKWPVQIGNANSGLFQEKPAFS